MVCLSSEVVEYGAYYYRVRSKAGVDNYSFPSEVGLIVTSPSNSDFLIALAASEIGYDGFTANWSELPGEYTYQLIVNTDFDFDVSTEFVFDGIGMGIAGSDYVVEGFNEWNYLLL